jgi:hypothetical protein
MAIQAWVDITRDLDWSKESRVIRVQPKATKTYFLLHLSLVMILLGKAHYELTGVPTLGVIGLYLVMISNLIQVYPYIVCTQDTLNLCAHALRPKLTLERKHIHSVRKLEYMLILTFQPEDPEGPLQQIQIDGRAFDHFDQLEDWLGLRQKTDKLPDQAAA